MRAPRQIGAGAFGVYGVFRLTTSRKTENGCRPDQLFGLWAMEPATWSAMVDQALAADLKALQAQAAAAAAPAGADEPYTVTNDGIAVIELTGPLTKYRTSFQSMLGGTSTIDARAALRAAARDPDVLGILLHVESPGGTAAGTDELAQAVRAADAQKPVYAYIEDIGASAAYWAAAQARKVYGNPMAQVGSIGTFGVLTDSSGRYERDGIKKHVISSAELKGFADGAPITEAQRADAKRVVLELNAVFVAGVASGRRIPAEQAQELADGRMHVGEKAREIGLIDAVASREVAMRELVRETMETSDVKAILAKTEKERDQYKAALEAAQKTAPPPADPLASLTPAARAVVEQAQKDAAAAQSALSVLQEQLDTKAFAEKVKAFDAIPGAASDAFAQVLRAISGAVKPEQLKALETVLAAANAAVKAGGLFSETGTSAPTGAGAEFEGLAQAAVKAGRAKDIYEAYKLVARENPKAYQEHRAHVQKGAA